MSIRARIIISYILIIGIGFFYLVKKITDAREIKPRYMESIEEPMVDMANLLASVVELQSADGPLELGGLRETFQRATQREFVAQIYSKKKTSVDLHFYVTNAEGTVVFDSDGGKTEGQDYSQWNNVYLTLRGKYGARSTREQADDPTSSVIHVSAPIVQAGRIAGVLTVTKPQKSMAAFIQGARHRIILTGLLAGTAVILVGSIFATWLTEPIKRLTGYAKAVRDGRRVALPKLGKGEVAALGHTIEDMRDALEGKKYVENYVQTLTHEIKSPVAAIRGAAELLQEQMPLEQRERFRNNIVIESTRIQEIVDRLLLLSAVEARKALEERHPVNLSELFRSVISGMEPQAASKRITVEIAPTAGGCTVPGDRFLLEKALVNLLQNAVAFTPEGGRIDCACRKEARHCVVTIEDSGPGVPEFAQERIFERFYSLPRPDSGKKSSGLGLAFVREVAVLHGGSASVENRADGGARATLTLPMAGQREPRAR